MDITEFVKSIQEYYDRESEEVYYLRDGYPDKPMNLMALLTLYKSFSSSMVYPEKLEQYNPESPDSWKQGYNDAIDEFKSLNSSIVYPSEEDALKEIERLGWNIKRGSSEVLDMLRVYYWTVKFIEEHKNQKHEHK